MIQPSFIEIQSRDKRLLNIFCYLFSGGITYSSTYMKLYLSIFLSLKFSLFFFFLSPTGVFRSGHNFVTTCYYKQQPKKKENKTQSATSHYSYYYREYTKGEFVTLSQVKGLIDISTYPSTEYSSLKESLVNRLCLKNNSTPHHPQPLSVQ